MEAALRSTGGNVRGAARRLKISKNSFYRWASQYGMHRMMGLFFGEDSQDGDDTDDTDDTDHPDETCVPQPTKIRPILGGEMKDDPKALHSIKISESQWQWLKHQAVDARAAVSDVVSGLIANAQEAAQSNKKR